ncbi:hypothetical protein F5Y07DRAFT_384888, partial [Xylaria sp. FL0933]
MRWYRWSENASMVVFYGLVGFGCLGLLMASSNRTGAEGAREWAALYATPITRGFVFSTAFGVATALRRADVASNVGVVGSGGGGGGSDDDDSPRLTSNYQLPVDVGKKRWHCTPSRHGRLLGRGIVLRA